jgi:lipocalin
MKTVKTVSIDLDKYLGTWYELARYDHPFERNLTAVTATYSLKPNGKIKVLNKGYLNSQDGKLKKAVGKAKIPDKNNPGHLKVSFFLFFYADYYVLELDPDYKWALVGSSSPNYLWILCRIPKPDKETIDKILTLTEKRGYDLSKLIWVEHK